MTANQINYWKLKETERSNKVNEGENLRSHKASEALKGRELDEGERHNRAVETTAAFNAMETQRHNIAGETETHRSNVARETETERSNRAREDETQRANLSNEYLKGLDLAEKAKHNRAVESLEDRKHQETIRSNVEREYETNRSNKAKESLESLKESDLAYRERAKQSEIERSNKAKEDLQQQSIDEQQRYNYVLEDISRKGKALEGLNSFFGNVMKFGPSVGAFVGG